VVFTVLPRAWLGKRHRRSRRSKPPPRKLPHSDFYDGLARADYEHILPGAISQLPQPRPYFGSGNLFRAGAPRSGPIPLMLDGGCPFAYLVKRDGACYATGS
jgi:hypothetical protein